MFGVPCSEVTRAQYAAAVEQTARDTMPVVAQRRPLVHTAQNDCA
jgi:hypothetical protein